MKRNVAPKRYAIARFIEAAKTLYHRVPGSLRRVFSPLIFCLRLLRQVRLELWMLEGEELSTRAPLSILCAMNDGNRSYLSGLAFGKTYSEYYLGRAWLWNINRMIKKKGRGYSMIFVELNRSKRRLLGLGNWFFIPEWLNGIIDFPFKSKSTNGESIKTDLRRVQKNAFRFEVTRETQRFHDFYHNMHVPHIVRAHCRSAYIMPYESMRRRFQNCDLLLVTKQQKHIAGILIEYGKSGPRLWSMGIRDGNPKYLRQGAGGALYYFSLQYLEGRGFSRVHSGLSRAFLSDGVLRYKRKWAQRIAGMSSKMFALKILSYTTSTRAFLENNPFIFENRGSPYGAVFVDTGKLPSPQELEQIDKDYLYPGLSRLFVYLLRRNDRPKRNVVPPGLSERIVLRVAKDLGGG